MSKIKIMMPRKVLNKWNYIFSKQYDYKIVDNTWRCVFCHQKSHYKVSRRCADCLDEKV
jgi:hypothetical protein